MADLRPRIEKLVGRLVAGRDSPIPRLAGGSPPELRPGDAGFAEAVARLAAMPLARYAHEGAPLEVQVPWLGETLWFVPGDRQAEALVGEGVDRGRIWTTTELMGLMCVRACNAGKVSMIALTRIASSGDITEVRFSAETTSPASPPRSPDLCLDPAHLQSEGH